MFTTRLLNAASDLPALVRLRSAVAEQPLTEDAVSARLRSPHQDPQHDHWIAEAEGDLIGYGNLLTPVAPRSQGLLEVHPAWRRRGVGRTLLACLLERARVKGARHFAFNVNETNTGAQAFLARQGFEQISDYWGLVAPTAGEVPEPIWPSGYAVRTYAELNDLPLLVKICNASRRDMWGHWENYEGGVTEAVIGRWLPNWDATGIFIAFTASGEAVGICRAETGQPALIDAPTIVPEHRAHGLHRPLLLSALRWLRAHSVERMALEAWGDTPQAIEVYQSLGFAIEEHYLAYRLLL